MVNENSAKKASVNILCGFEGVVCNCKDPINKQKFRSGNMGLMSEVPYQPGLLKYMQEIAVYSSEATHKLFVRCEFGTLGFLANKWLARKDFAKFDGVLCRDKVVQFKNREDFREICVKQSADIVISDRVEYLNYAEDAGVKHLILFDHGRVSEKENKHDMKKNRGKNIHVVESYSELLPLMKNISDHVIAMSI